MEQTTEIDYHTLVGAQVADEWIQRDETLTETLATSAWKTATRAKSGESSRTL